MVRVYLRCKLKHISEKRKYADLLLADKKLRAATLFWNGYHVINYYSISVTYSLWDQVKGLDQSACQCVSSTVAKNECNVTNVKLRKCTLTGKSSGKGITDLCYAYFVTIILKVDLISLGILPYPYISVKIYLVTDLYSGIKRPLRKGAQNSHFDKFLAQSLKSNPWKAKRSFHVKQPLRFLK